MAILKAKIRQMKMVQMKINLSIRSFFFRVFIHLFYLMSSSYVIGQYIQLDSTFFKNAIVIDSTIFEDLDLFKIQEKFGFVKPEKNRHIHNSFFFLVNYNYWVVNYAESDLSFKFVKQSVFRREKKLESITIGSKAKTVSTNLIGKKYEQIVQEFYGIKQNFLPSHDGQLELWLSNDKFRIELINEKSDDKEDFVVTKVRIVLLYTL